jgi:hypothetical protein
VIFPGKRWSSRSADTGLQIHRRNRLQPETGRTSKRRDYQMAKGKCKNLTKGNQDYMASSEPRTPTTSSSGYPNIGNQQSDLKSYLMMLVEDFKKKQDSSLPTNLEESHMNRIPILTTKITGNNNDFSLISLNISGLNPPIKRGKLIDWLYKQDPFFAA